MERRRATTLLTVSICSAIVAGGAACGSGAKAVGVCKELSLERQESPLSAVCWIEGSVDVVALVGDGVLGPAAGAGFAALARRVVGGPLPVEAGGVDASAAFEGWNYALAFDGYVQGQPMYTMSVTAASTVDRTNASRDLQFVLATVSAKYGVESGSIDFVGSGPSADRSGVTVKWNGDAITGVRWQDVLPSR